MDLHWALINLPKVKHVLCGESFILNVAGGGTAKYSWACLVTPRRQIMCGKWWGDGVEVI